MRDVDHEAEGAPMRLPVAIAAAGIALSIVVLVVVGFDALFRWVHPWGTVERMELAGACVAFVVLCFLTRAFAGRRRR